MNRLIKIAMITLMSAALLTGCGTKADNNASNTNGTDTDNQVSDDTSLNDIKSKGKLVLGFDEAFPPMGYRNEDQELVGFDLDVAKEVCDRMGVELVLQPIDWDSKDLELKTKNIDCIWNGFTYTTERGENYECSIPYMKNTQVAVTLSTSDATSLEDLAGKTVVIQSGSSAEQAVNDNKEFKDSLKELVTVSDNIKALMDLKINASDAVVMDEIVARYYIAKDSSYKILDETLADEEYVVGFRKGDVSLSEEVNKQLREMKADGTLGEISENWFGEDMTIVE